MKPKKTFHPEGSRIKLYSDRLEIDKFGCLSKKTSYIPLQQIRKVYARSGWLYIETTDETHKSHFETSDPFEKSILSTKDDDHEAQRAAKEINKIIQDNDDGPPPGRKSVPPKTGSCSGSFIGLILLATVGLVILIGLGYIRFPIPPPTPTYTPEVTYTGEVISSINIRAKPSLESTILGAFSAGTIVTVLDCTPIKANEIPWIKVQGISSDSNQSLTGYISSFSEYIQTDCP